MCFINAHNQKGDYIFLNPFSMLGYCNLLAHTFLKHADKLHMQSVHTNVLVKMFITELQTVIISI